MPTNLSILTGFILPTLGRTVTLSHVMVFIAFRAYKSFRLSPPKRHTKLVVLLFGYRDREYCSVVE